MALFIGADAGRLLQEHTMGFADGRELMLDVFVRGTLHALVEEKAPPREATQALWATLRLQRALLKTQGAPQRQVPRLGDLDLGLLAQLQIRRFGLHQRGPDLRLERLAAMALNAASSVTLRAISELESRKEPWCRARYSTGTSTDPSMPSRPTVRSSERGRRSRGAQPQTSS